MASTSLRLSRTGVEIVADEPTSALDRDRQMAFLDVLFTQVADVARSDSLQLLLYSVFRIGNGRLL
jgi:ABC-type dipeptide/oligopeptide/nickel transport system ATPase component